MQAENPDIVVITGDYVDDDTKRQDMVDACRALGTFKTTYGVYYVLGNHIFIRVKPLHKLCCRSPAAPPLRLRTILSSNHIKAVIQQDRFILKHDNAVLFKLRNQVIPVKPPVICAIIAPVMVAENIVHPVGGPRINI